jgi:TolA-binding protein
MSANDRADLRAFKELEALVRSLGEELAVFRRRAIAAEGQSKDGGPAKGSGRATVPAGRVADLESENESLRLRLGRAEDRVRQMMERVRFLRQQLQAQSTAPAGRS